MLADFYDFTGCFFWVVGFYFIFPLRFAVLEMVGFFWLSFDQTFRPWDLLFVSAAIFSVHGRPVGVSPAMLAPRLPPAFRCTCLVVTFFPVSFQR